MRGVAKPGVPPLQPGQSYTPDQIEPQAHQVHQIVAGERFGLEVGVDQAQAAQANDFFRFTSQLNERCSQPDKIALIEAMWQVAYADGQLDVHENHVISKVAGLLHVTHGEYIAAKLRARDQAG